jgi:hypothetical protein
MKYQRIIDRIQQGSLTRDDLIGIRDNAKAKLAAGDKEAQTVLGALGVARAADDAFFFMGFCPWGKIENRLDAKWRAEGILTFDFDASVKQTRLFDKIVAGDLIILKKRERIGVSMILHGHGRVTAVDYTSGSRNLKVAWAMHGGAISVPLMGCNETVNRRDRRAIEEAMPLSFFEWLAAESND